jgi:hypothetical protein
VQLGIQTGKEMLAPRRWPPFRIARLAFLELLTFESFVHGVLSLLGFTDTRLYTIGVFVNADGLKRRFYFPIMRYTHCCIISVEQGKTAVCPFSLAFRSFCAPTQPHKTA